MVDLTSREENNADMQIRINSDDGATIQNPEDEYNEQKNYPNTS